jgi:hypothetical protein
MAATEFEFLGELEEEAEFEISPEHELQSYPISESVAETEWEQMLGCPRPTRIVVSGFPRYSIAVTSLPKSEQNRIKGVASLIARSFRPGCRPIRHVRIVGYADRDLQRGPAFEKSVSLRRAVSVQRALQGQLRTRGVSSPLFWSAFGVGAARRAIPAPTTEQQRALNRRVEILAGGARPPALSLAELGRIAGSIGLDMSEGALRQLQSGQAVSLAGRSPEEVRSAVARARAHFAGATSTVTASGAIALPSWIRDCSRASCKGACVVVKRGVDRFGRKWVACLCIGFFWVGICSQWLPDPIA